MIEVRPFRREYRQLAVVASLVFASVVCAAMLLLRILYSHSLSHTMLAWNLFLAWVPMLISLTAYNLSKRSTRWNVFLILVCAFAWLLFFPNAPYILTDLIHLRASNGIPVWYDLIMLLMFAWTGVFLGLISLVLMQNIVRRSAGTAISWLFVLVVLGLSGFGVYLGRFPRWNSWDVFTSPTSLLSDIWEGLLHPLDHPRTIAFSGMFSLLLAAVYLMISALIQFFQPLEGGHGSPHSTGDR